MSQDDTEISDTINRKGSKQNAVKKEKKQRACEVAYQVKVLAAMLEDLRLILGTYARVERENQCHIVIFCLQYTYCNGCPRVIFNKMCVKEIE